MPEDTLPLPVLWAVALTPAGGPAPDYPQHRVPWHWGPNGFHSSAGIHGVCGVDYFGQTLVLADSYPALAGLQERCPRCAKSEERA